MREPIIDFLRRELKAAGSGQWEWIAAAANSKLPSEARGITRHSLRKIAYGDRSNPGLRQVQALLDVLKARR